MNDHDDDNEVLKDFYTWCELTRLLGRDRMVAAFRAGWSYGFATGVDRAVEQMHEQRTDEA